jgi:hypothetical protein
MYILFYFIICNPRVVVYVVLMWCVVHQVPVRHQVHQRNDEQRRPARGTEEEQHAFRKWHEQRRHWCSASSRHRLDVFSVTAPILHLLLSDEEPISIRFQKLFKCCEARKTCDAQEEDRLVACWWPDYLLLSLRYGQYSDTMTLSDVTYRQKSKYRDQWCLCVATSTRTSLAKGRPSDEVSGMGAGSVLCCLG